jgi:hypothetical protein
MYNRSQVFLVRTVVSYSNSNFIERLVVTYFLFLCAVCCMLCIIFCSKCSRGTVYIKLQDNDLYYGKIFTGKFPQNKEEFIVEHDHDGFIARSRRSRWCEATEALTILSKSMIDRGILQSLKL